MRKSMCLSMVAVILILSILSVLLISCGNMSVGPGNYNFKHIHFADYSGNAVCATVEKWYDNTTGIEVRTIEYGALYFSEGTYFLIEDKAYCPFCSNKEPS